MTFDEINDKTGFANGSQFETPVEVRNYFTLENMAEMFGRPDKFMQVELDWMAAKVMGERWHCAF